MRAHIEATQGFIKVILSDRTIPSFVELAIRLGERKAALLQLPSKDAVEHLRRITYHDVPPPLGVPPATHRRAEHMGRSGSKGGRTSCLDGARFIACGGAARRCGRHLCDPARSVALERRPRAVRRCAQNKADFDAFRLTRPARAATLRRNDLFGMLRLDHPLTPLGVEQAGGRTSLFPRAEMRGPPSE